MFSGNNSGTAWPILDLIFALESFFVGLSVNSNRHLIPGRRNALDTFSGKKINFYVKTGFFFTTPPSQSVGCGAQHFTGRYLYEFHIERYRSRGKAHLWDAWRQLGKYSPSKLKKSGERPVLIPYGQKKTNLRHWGLFMEWDGRVINQMGTSGRNSWSNEIHFSKRMIFFDLPYKFLICMWY